MPLPKGAEDFLDIALDKAHKGTIIHFYDFEHEHDFELTKKKFSIACADKDVAFSVLEFVTCGQYSPGKYRICLDAQEAQQSANATGDTVA